MFLLNMKFTLQFMHQNHLDFELFFHVEGFSKSSETKEMQYSSHSQLNTMFKDCTSLMLCNISFCKP